MVDPLQCRMARAVLDLTTRQLARRAGLPPSTITRLESGQAVSAERLSRLREVLEAAGVILVAEDAAEGSGIRLAKDFRRGFVFDGHGRHVASIVGKTVVDPLRETALARVDGEGLFTLDGASLGEMGMVDTIRGTASLSDTSMRLLAEAEMAPLPAEDPASLALLLDGSDAGRGSR